MLRHTDAGAVEYGLVTHQPSGDIYLMRFEDGAVCGPLYHSDHYAVFQNARHYGFWEVDIPWANSQEWALHNLNGTCEGCRE